MTILVSQAPEYWDYKYDCHHAWDFVLTIYETKRSFLTSLIRSTVSVVELTLASHFRSSWFCFPQARTTGMCHHGQFKVHACPSISSPLLQGFQGENCFSLSLEVNLFNYLRFYLTSTHLHINDAAQFWQIKTLLHPYDQAKDLDLVWKVPHS